MLGLRACETEESSKKNNQIPRTTCTLPFETLFYSTLAYKEPRDRLNVGVTMFSVR